MSSLPGPPSSWSCPRSPRTTSSLPSPPVDVVAAVVADHTIAVAGSAVERVVAEAAVEVVDSAAAFGLDRCRARWRSGRRPRRPRSPGRWRGRSRGCRRPDRQTGDPVRVRPLAGRRPRRRRDDRRPRPPTTVSSPGPPQILSFPFAPPLILSSPPRPKITSLAFLPTITSSPAVPTIVARLPPQDAAEASLQAGSRRISAVPRTAATTCPLDLRR